MAEPGGPTTQSGIFYQNTIAALYLGALLDIRVPMQANARVVAVRVEAPEEIDDIVVTRADNSKVFVQAKENLVLHGDAWEKFWLAAKRQAQKHGCERDEFKLVLGTLGAELELLRETLERAQGKRDVEEWKNSLNGKQGKILHLILKAISLPDEDAFLVVKKTRVEFITLQYAETFAARDWMPQASDTPAALHSRLRDCCGRAARIRQVFYAGELSERLLKDFSIRIYGSHGDGLERYCAAIATYVDQIGVPGTSISVREEELFIWPTVFSVEKNADLDFEDEDPWHSRRYSGQETDLHKFPNDSLRCAILESPAGHGKSTVLRAVVRRLALSSSYVPALIHAEALQDHATIQEYLNSSYNSRYEVSINWTALCEQGRAIIVIDGIDELADAARVTLINMVGRAVAQFDRVPFLIGARDSAVTTFPPQFKLLRLQRLNYKQMVSMLEVYFLARGKFDVRTIVRHIHAYQEIEQLCRIPLFLAIFAATLPRHGAIPTGRTEILERYLSHALSPERHKGVKKFLISKTQLRKGAEEFATLSLKRNEAAVLEVLVRTRLSDVLGEPSGDDCVDALIQHGLIERRGSRLSFCIPTVQEYLAGCVLASTGKLNSEEWIQSIYRRPWAQAVQFAVERNPNADDLLTRQLTLDDDIFHTSLRLIARCIVNGAVVSNVTKESVAVRLARALTSAGHKTKERISYLIADGFCKPMHHEIRRVLIAEEHISFWRGHILVRAADNELTIECLKAVLNRKDIRELWDRDWLSAIISVKSSAVDLLMDRARKEQISNLSAKVIAEVFYQLRDLSLDEWEDISCDESLPVVVRAAASFAISKDQGGPDPKIIEAAFADSKESYLWNSFHSAYTSTTWWKQHLKEIYHCSPESGRGNAMNYLDDMTENRQEKLDFLAEMARDPLTNPIYRFRLQALLGGFGYVEFAKAATEALGDVSYDETYYWIEEAPYFSIETIKEGIRILVAREFSSKQKVTILENLQRLAEYQPAGERKSISEHGPFKRSEYYDELVGCLVESAERLISEEGLNANEKRDLKFILAELGSDAAGYEIAVMLKDYLHSIKQIDILSWNTWVAPAINLISSARFQYEGEIFWGVLKKGLKLPMYSVVQTIIENEGEDSYLKLIDFVNEFPRSSAWSAVYSYFEDNAERQGIKVQYIRNKLHIFKV